MTGSYSSAETERRWCLCAENEQKAKTGIGALEPKDKKGHTHGLDIQQIKELDKLIESPLMVMDSISNNKSIIAVTSETDKDGLPIMVSITPNGKGRYELEETDSNFITSVYGRNNFENQLNKALQDDKILYANKEKSQKLFSVLGLQLSQGLNSLDFNTIIHKSRNIVNEKAEEKISESEEKTGIGYTLQDNYYLPDFALPADEERAIGIWGQRHGRYLKEQHRILYYNLLTTCKLSNYLADIDRQAEELFSRLVKQTAEREGVTEKLKAEDGMKWVQAMNNIRNRAAEVVYNDLIYN